jgi:CRP/FNR family transcriptional regulator
MPMKSHHPQHATNHGPSNCAACSLRDDMVCADISVDEVIGFHAEATDSIFPRGMMLQTVDAPVTAVYCIREGAVKMVKYDANGGQRIVRVLKKGDIAGIDWAFSGKAEYAAIAIGEVHACRIPVKFFLDFISRHADLQIRLLHKFQDALCETELWLSQLVGGTIPSRVRMARILLRLREGDDERIHRLTNEDMGAILGVTEETVSRVLAEFQRQGILMRDWESCATKYLRADISALEIIAADV